jgi:hypothetical protein
MTNEIPSESTFDDRAVAGYRSTLRRREEIKQESLTKAISSLTLGIDAAGTKAANSTRLS